MKRGILQSHTYRYNPPEMRIERRPNRNMNVDGKETPAFPDSFPPSLLSNQKLLLYYTTKHRTPYHGAVIHCQAVEDSLLTTTANAITTPHLHFSQIIWRHVVAHPVPGAGGLRLSRPARFPGDRVSGMMRAADDVVGVDVDVDVDGVSIGEAEVVWEVATEADEAVGGGSGFPSERSPMFGSSRGSGVQ